MEAEEVREITTRELVGLEGVQIGGQGREGELECVLGHCAKVRDAHMRLQRRFVAQKLLASKHRSMERIFDLNRGPYKMIVYSVMKTYTSKGLL